MANTEYVLSAYIWNLSGNGLSVNANVDFDANDGAGDPNLSLFPTDPDGSGGYFVYQSFNTADTGTSLNVRAFYDNRVGGNTGWPFQPVAAQWDNIAVTLASDFQAPLAVVPEPASLTLLGLGVAGLLGYRWRNRKQPAAG